MYNLMGVRKNILAFVYSIQDAIAANKMYLISGMVLVLASGTCQVSLPSVVGRLVDVLSLNEECSEIVLWGAFFFGVFGLNTVLTLLKKYCFTKFAEKTTIAITGMLFSKIIRFPLCYFDKNSIGDLASRINNDIQSMKRLFSEQTAQLLYHPFVILGCLCNLFLVNVKLTLLLLMVFPVIMWLSIRFGNRIKALSKKTFDMYADANKILVEDLRLIRVVKSFNGEKAEDRRFDSILDGLEKKAVEANFSITRLQAAISLMLLVGLSVVICYALFLIGKSEMTSGQLLEFLMCSIFIINALSNSANTYGIVMNSAGMLGYFRQLLNQDMEDVECVTGADIQFEELSFRDVDFIYSIRNSLILKKICFSIRKGEKIGVFGASGEGKSTLVKLMMRFYNPTRGEICVNNVNARQFPLASYRKIFGYVSQEVELFSGSIKENIMYPEVIPEERMLEMAKKSCAHEFIMRLPQGYDTKVGENGVNLSGGQRQRISIARALAKQSQILILDEATSALDRETEESINQFVSCNTSDLTIIVLSHKISIINKMDRVFRIENNSLIEINNCS